MTFAHQYVPLQIEEHARYKDRQRRYLEASSDAQIQMRLLAEKRAAQRRARGEWNRRARQEQERYQMQCLAAVAALQRGIAQALRPPPTQDEIAKAVRSQISMSDIINAVAKHQGVTREDVLSRRRASVVVWPRQYAMYLSKVMTLRSLPEIGRKFLRDHTTVLYGVRKIEALVESDQELRDSLSFIRAEVESSAHERAALALRITVEQVRAAVNDAA